MIIVENKKLLIFIFSLVWILSPVDVSLLRQLKWEENHQKYLPTVAIKSCLPKTDKHVEKQKIWKTIPPSNSSNVDTYTNFLIHYEKLVDKNPDLIFIPTINSPQYSDWVEIEKKIEEHASSLSDSHFALDKIFIVCTHPLFLHGMGSNISLTHVRHIRFFRADNELTRNGRDIFIPYLHEKAAFRPITSFEKRKYFVFHPGASKGDARKFRKTLKTSFENLPNSFITTERINRFEFTSALESSDFCFIVGGDTSSTSKLYQAIFAGCIPVIFVSFPQQLPFYHLLSWEKFSIIVYKDFIRIEKRMMELKELLERIRHDEGGLLREYKRNVEEAGKYFDYTRKEWPNPYMLSLMQMKMESVDGIVWSSIIPSSPLSHLFRQESFNQFPLHNLPSICEYIIESKSNQGIAIHNNTSFLNANPSINLELFRFIDFIENSYPNRIKQEDCYHTKTNFTFFIFNTNLSISNTWTWMNHEIESFAHHAAKHADFVLDKSFVILPFPFSFYFMGPLNLHRPNIRDLRYFRYDNQFTRNGRDIFIPYLIDVRRKINHNHPSSGSSFSVKQKRNIFTLLVKNEQEKEEKLQSLLQQYLPEVKSINSYNQMKSDYDHKVWQAMGNADFCLILGNEIHPSTSKLYQAIFAGCIPVIFVSFPQQLPFYHLLSWEKFSIIVYKDFIRIEKRMMELKELLERIRHDEGGLLREYKRNVEEAGKYFDYTRKDWPNPYMLSLMQMKMESVDGIVWSGTPIDQLGLWRADIP